MKTFFALTTGILVGMFGTAAIFLASTDVQDCWNAVAEKVSKW